MTYHRPSEPIMRAKNSYLLFVNSSLDLLFACLHLVAHPVGRANYTRSLIIGYGDEKGIHFFEGSISGVLVPPRGTDGFGWDAIFQPDDQPDGCKKTFAEMTPEEKSRCSMRKRAVEGLRQYLIEQEQKGSIS